MPTPDDNPSFNHWVNGAVEAADTPMVDLPVHVQVSSAVEAQTNDPLVNLSVNGAMEAADTPMVDPSVQVNAVEAQANGHSVNGAVKAPINPSTDPSVLARRAFDAYHRSRMAEISVNPAQEIQNHPPLDINVDEMLNSLKASVDLVTRIAMGSVTSGRPHDVANTAELARLAGIDSGTILPNYFQTHASLAQSILHIYNPFTIGMPVEAEKLDKVKTLLTEMVEYLRARIADVRPNVQSPSLNLSLQLAYILGQLGLTCLHVVHEREKKDMTPDIVRWMKALEGDYWGEVLQERMDHENQLAIEQNQHGARLSKERIRHNDLIEKEWNQLDVQKAEHAKKVAALMRERKQFELEKEELETNKAIWQIEKDSLYDGMDNLRESKAKFDKEVQSWRFNLEKREEDVRKKRNKLDSQRDEIRRLERHVSEAFQKWNQRWNLDS